MYFLFYNARIEINKLLRTKQHIATIAILLKNNQTNCSELHKYQVRALVFNWGVFTLHTFSVLS